MGAKAQPTNTRTPKKTASPKKQTSADGVYLPMAEQVAESIRQAIFNGELSPGQPVRQEAFAAKVGTSRIPVREALRQLEAEGLITIRPHSGARVAVVDYDECAEVYKIRERLEPLAFGESVLHITDEQVDDVREKGVAIEKLTGDRRAWIEADRLFHLACYQGARLPRLLRVIDVYWNTTQQYRRIVLSTFSDDDFTCYHGEHRLMIDAMRTRNVRAGEDVVRMHIERARLRLAEHPELFG